MEFWAWFLGWCFWTWVWDGVGVHAAGAPPAWSLRFHASPSLREGED